MLKAKEHKLDQRNVSSWAHVTFLQSNHIWIKSIASHVDNVMGFCSRFRSPEKEEDHLADRLMRLETQRRKMNVQPHGSFVYISGVWTGP